MACDLQVFQNLNSPDIGQVENCLDLPLGDLMFWNNVVKIWLLNAILSVTIRK